MNVPKFNRCPCTLSSVLLINIVGQVSLDYQSTICQVSNRRDTHSGYYVTVVHRVHRLQPPSMMQTQFAYTLNRCSRRFQVVSWPIMTLFQTQTIGKLKPWHRDMYPVWVWNKVSEQSVKPWRMLDRLLSTSLKTAMAETTMLTINYL